MSTPLRALIFDVDGTLSETEEAHRMAFNDSFDHAGLGWHWSREDYRRLLKTTGGKERIRAFLAESGKSDAGLDIAALHAAKTRRYVEILENGGLALREGVEALMVAARGAGMRLAIATTTSRPNVEALCRCCWGKAAAELFDVIAAGDEVATKKPAPDVYALALERLGLPAGEVLALEDSRNGVLSAQRAGIAVLVTPSVYTAGEDFAGAEIVASLAPGELPSRIRDALSVGA